MELRWPDRELRKFITNVGLITSNGPYGLNVMACEWTHQISYDPGLIAISSHIENATTDNILKTKEFGVNICATDQNVLSSIAGNYSTKEYDKIKILEELGFRFYKAESIDALMVEGAVMNIECKVVQQMHNNKYYLFVGEVVNRKDNPGKEPLAYHKGTYYRMDSRIPKPSEGKQGRIERVIEKHKRL
jgi:flavin reductase (DIM6/NTAB) family NADH-FMN oxidoreductase RutF